MPLRHIWPQPFLWNAASMISSGSAVPVRSIAFGRTTKGSFGLFGIEPSSAKRKVRGSTVFVFIILPRVTAGPCPAMTDFHSRRRPLPLVLAHHLGEPLEEIM